MNHKTAVAFILFVTTLLLASAGCSEQQKAKRAVANFDLLAHVPADTPYVAAASRPMPKKLSRHLLKAAAMQFDEKNFEALVETGKSGDSGMRRLVRLAMAVDRELKDKLSPEGLASLGFPVNGRKLVYGLGVLPVVWIEIQDPDKVGALLDRIEQRAGEHSQHLKQGNTKYRRYDFGKLTLVTAVKARYLVFALLPAAEEKSFLPLALGEEHPQKSLADGNAFAKFSVGHGFKGYGEGYIDLARLVEMLQGGASGINRQVLEALGYHPKLLSEGCRKLSLYLVSAMPRLSFGYTEVRDHGYDAEGVWEASPQVGNWLQQMAAPVPGLGKAEGAMASFGLGLDLARVRDGLRALLATVRKQSAQCRKVDDQSVAQAMQSINLVFNPLVVGVKGFNLVLDRVELDPSTLQPRSAQARLLVSAIDPRGLLGMAASLDPKLATIQIPQNGTPVALPVQEIMPGFPTTWAAIKGQILGLFLGGKPADAVKILSDTPASPRQVMALSYDVAKLMQQLGPSLEKNMQTLQGPDAEEARSLFQAMKRAAEVYERVGVGLKGEKRGLVVTARVAFRKE